MRDVLINHRPRMNIPPTRPIPLSILGKQPSMIPLADDNCRDGRFAPTQSRNRLLNSRDLQVLDLGELALRHTVAEIHHPLGESIRVLFVELDDLGDHASDPEDGLFAVVLVEGQWTGVFDTFVVDATDHGCETGRSRPGSRMRYVGPDKHLPPSVNAQKQHN